MNLKKHCAAVIGGMLLMTCTAAVLPQNPAYTQAVLSASAAEADYDWSGFLKKSNDWFGSSEATKIADECIQYQVANEGGWQKGMLTSHSGDWAHSTIDNDATTSQIRFLMRTYAQTGQQKYLDCAMRGIDCLFKMQYSNGGWMQCLNTPGTYHAHITLNDGAYCHVLQIMQEMAGKTGDFTAVSDEYAAKAAASLEKGIQCLLDMQISVNGTKTAWCQQHDENNLKPAGARAYELPSICTSESAGVITFLYNYAKAHPERSDIKASVNAAITWFKKAALYDIKFDWNSDKSDKVVTQVQGAGPIWARFYTLDTEKPMFSDRDGGTYYDVMQISQERRTGYAWYGNWGKNIISLALLEEGGEPVQTTEPVPVQKPEYTGKLIAKLVVNDIEHGGSWSIQQGFGNGSKIFGDREYTIVNDQGEKTGGELIQTACDSKKYSGDLAELTAAADLKLSIIIDVRTIQYVTENNISPNWLDDYTHMRTQVFSSNGEEFTVYVRELKAGETVTLGSNFTSQNCVNYFAAVFPMAAETTESETTTETTTTTTTTEPETTTTVPETTTTVPETVPDETTTETTALPETSAPAAETTTEPVTETTVQQIKAEMLGDATCNDEIDVSDAVLIARYGLADPGAKITAQGRANADVNRDGNADSADVILVLQYIAHFIHEFA